MRCAFFPRLSVVTCYRAFFGMLLTVCCFSACRWLGRVRWAAAGFAPHARITNMSRMNLPARRVSWDGGQMMTWQVGETKTETVFVFITSFIHTPCPLPLKRFTLIILPISCVYPELNHSTFSGADSPVLSIVIFPHRKAIHTAPQWSNNTFFTMQVLCPCFLHFLKP